ncbi:MAG: YidC/Oxa1 family membrane protein insertase, partial [Pseudomonadota bacterium]
WITDMSVPDPYYVLPVIMGVSMWVQSKLSPTPADPIQAKVMQIMPIAFSIFFFFFPSGLVLYSLCNNILSIAQQWQITRMFENKAEEEANKDKNKKKRKSKSESVDEELRLLAPAEEEANKTKEEVLVTTSTELKEKPQALTAATTAKSKAPAKTKGTAASRKPKKK